MLEEEWGTSEGKGNTNTGDHTSKWQLLSKYLLSESFLGLGTRKKSVPKKSSINTHFFFYT